MDLLNSISIRYAELRDLEAIVDIYNSTVPSRMVTADTEPVTTESRLIWFHQHHPESRPLWVIERENNILGWISFQSFYGRPAYNATSEISIYLDPNARGIGLGQKALQFAIQQAPALGISTILGFIFAHNHPSLRLFEKHRFEIWGTLPDVAVLDGIKRTLLILGLRLT